MKTEQKYSPQKTQSLLYIFLCGLCVLGGEQKLCFAAEPMANANLDGLYARSIEQVLRLSPEQIDTGTAALIVSEAWSDMVAGRRYQQQLDDIATEIRSRLKTPKPTVEAIPVINSYLFDELKFGTIAKADDPMKLQAWWTSDDQKTMRRNLALDQDEVDALKNAVIASMSCTTRLI